MRTSVRRIMAAVAAGSLSVGLLLPTGGVAQAQSCGGSAWAAPGTWGPEAQDITTNIAGSPGHTQGYSFSVNGDAIVLLQARGYDANGAIQWFNIGPPTDIGDGGTVPWGNTLGYPAVRAQTVGPTGVFVSWSC